MITQLKQAIINKLQPLSSEVRIIADDTEGEAGSNNLVKGDYILRVGYAGGQFEPPSNTEYIGLQKCDRSFQVSIEIRDFRNEDKAVAMIEKVEKLLLGFKACVQGVVGEAYLESDNFQQNRESIYFYVINLTIPTIEIRHE